jgi:hypothetical protein
MDIDSMTLKELRNFCKSNNIQGCSRKTKKEIIESIKKINTEEKDTNLTTPTNTIKQIEDEVLNKKVNLLEYNTKYISKILNNTYIEELRKQYEPSNLKLQNIYNFIEAYRNVIKQKHTIEEGYNSMKLYMYPHANSVCLCCYSVPVH